MVDRRITELPRTDAITPANGNELVPLVKGVENYATTTREIAKLDNPDVPIVDGISFDTVAPAPFDVMGQLAWDTEEETLSLGLANDSALQLGQEMLYHVKNDSGALIPDGTLVMFAGTHGASGKLLITPAICDGSVSPKLIMGVTTHAIANGETGYVTHFGKVRGVNTTGYEDPTNPGVATILWGNPAVPGGMTRIKPQAPNLSVMVAAAINFKNNGELMVRVTHGETLDELHNVYTNGTKTDGDGLIWNAANNRWEPTKYLKAAILSQAQYDAIFDKGDTTMYLIYNAGNLVRIYVGEAIIFQAT